MGAPPPTLFALLIIVLRLSLPPLSSLSSLSSLLCHVALVVREEIEEIGGQALHDPQSSPLHYPRKASDWPSEEKKKEGRRRMGE